MALSETAFAQLVGICAGGLVLTAIVLVWRRSLAPSAVVLGIQGVALAALAALLGWQSGEATLFLVAGVVLLLKAVVVPVVLRRAAEGSPSDRDEDPLINTTSALVWAAILTLLAYVVAQPVTQLVPGPAVAAVPAGLALVLIGFLLLMIRRHAISQVVGFLVVDNGIAAVAFLTVGGLPLVVELGISLDVLLVVLILYVVTHRLTSHYGVVDLDELRELHD